MDLFAMLQDDPPPMRVVMVTNGHPTLSFEGLELWMEGRMPVRLPSIPPMKTLVFEVKEPE